MSKTVSAQVKVGRTTGKGSKMTLTIEFAEGTDTTAFFGELGHVLASRMTPEQAIEFGRQTGEALKRIASEKDRRTRSAVTARKGSNAE